MVFIFLLCGVDVCAVASLYRHCFKIEPILEWIKIIFNGTKWLSYIFTHFFLCKFFSSCLKIMRANC